MTSADGRPKGNQWTGELGEKVAAAWLRANGCKILARNFRARGGGEVDIVARDGAVLLFVEVKTRRGNSPIRPFDAVDKQKRQLIERGANAWLKQLGRRNLPWRFDVMEILLDEGEKPRVNQIRDAF